ncbi:MAG: hypothetical protein M3Q03_13040, partial [Chloroflexota bacterium]|nr:hypothetical protein [Chloroflexota bacterium]
MKQVRVLVALLVVLVTGIAFSARAQETAPNDFSPFASPVAVPAGTLPGNVSVQLVKVAGGLVDPVNITNAGDGSGRLFVVERIGRIRII